MIIGRSNCSVFTVEYKNLWHFGNWQNSSWMTICYLNYGAREKGIISLRYLQTVFTFARPTGVVRFEVLVYSGTISEGMASQSAEGRLSECENRRSVLSLKDSDWSWRDEGIWRKPPLWLLLENEEKVKYMTIKS